MEGITPPEVAKDLAPKKDIVETVAERVCLVFPEYTQMDRAEYDTYDPAADDTDRGRLLHFFTETGNIQGQPRLIFIYKKGGFALNYYDTPAPSTPYTVRNAGDTVYGPRERFWENSEVDVALEKAKVRMEGVDHTSEAFRTQLAGWSESEDRFITMGERIDAQQQLLAGTSSFKRKAAITFRPLRTPIRTLLEGNPEKARELVVTQLQTSPIYRQIDGSTSPTQDIVTAIQQNRPEGDNAITREINRIEAQEELLRMHKLL